MTTDLLRGMDEWGPEKVVCVSDSRTGMRGVLVIDNTARGMGKGGTRMSPSVTVARYSAFRPDPAAIFETVSSRLCHNTETVLDQAESTGVTRHEAALHIATGRVRTAMRLRGRLPR